MRIGLIGKKIGMTREFVDSGMSIPVTILSIEKGRIINVFTKEKRGYDAIQVGFGKIKTSKLKKQMKGFFAKKATEPRKILKEFRVNNIAEYKEGNEIGLELFKDEKFVDIKSKTIGKGFAGSMKRHNFSGLRATHGVSVSHRAHGSTGHMGDKFRTIQNLEIIKSDLENNLIFVKGSVPGSKNSIVLIQKNVKRIKRITTIEKNKKFIESTASSTSKIKDKAKTPEKKASTEKKPAKQPEKKEVKK